VNHRLELILLLLLFAPVAQAKHHHRTWAQECRGFDMCDGRLRQDIYDQKFGLFHSFTVADVVLRGSKFKIHNYWFDGGEFQPGVSYVIIWVHQRGYYLMSSDVCYPVRVL
jgi:hypothetical protein